MSIKTCAARKRLTGGTVIVLAVGVLAATARAHVVAAPDQAAPGAIVLVNFKAGHGCSDKPTTAIRVEVPARVVTAHPMDAKGWTLKVERKGTRVVAATWTAKARVSPAALLPMHVETPKAFGPLYFTAVQTCGKTVVRWDEQPRTGATGDLKRPAPKITVVANPATVGAASPEHRH